MTRIIIARHGNTFDAGDVVTRVGARTDLPLSGSGRSQGMALGGYFREGNVRFDVAYCSPLQRTKETAELILKGIQSNTSPSVLAFLTEIDYGPDENLPEDVVRERVGEAAIQKWEQEAIAPDGWIVDPEKLRQQWTDFFAQVHSEHSGRTVLVVTSNGIARFALQAIDPKASHVLKLKTGAYGDVSIDENGRPGIMEWNIRP